MELNNHLDYPKTVSFMKMHTYSTQTTISNFLICLYVWYTRACSYVHPCDSLWRPEADTGISSSIPSPPQFSSLKKMFFQRIYSDNGLPLQLHPDSPLHAMFFLFLFRKQPTAMMIMMIKIYRKSRNLQNVSRAKCAPPNETKVYRNTLEFILCWPSTVGRGAYF